MSYTATPGYFLILRHFDDLLLDKLFHLATRGYLAISCLLVSAIALYTLYYRFYKVEPCKQRVRYEWSDGEWKAFTTLIENPGIREYCLDEPQEKILHDDLDAFLHNKIIYKKLGVPYKRSILIQGHTGSGKTSLIHAISAELNRNLFYIDLSKITSDSDLRRCFISVPSGQIIVLEDVDLEEKFHFTMVSFHDCLDGYSLSGDNLILISTKKVETFDTNTLRAGRVDIHLTLKHCTKYQIRKIYQVIQGSAKTFVPENLLNQIPENLFSPCDIFAMMLSYRNMPPEIVFARIISEIPGKSYSEINSPTIHSKIYEKKREILDNFGKRIEFSIPDMDKPFNDLCEQSGEELSEIESSSESSIDLLKEIINLTSHSEK